jgi:hypothetical protein
MLKTNQQIIPASSKDLAQAYFGRRPFCIVAETELDADESYTDHFP